MANQQQKIFSVAIGPTQDNQTKRDTALFAVVLCLLMVILHFFVAVLYLYSPSVSLGIHFASFCSFVSLCCSFISLCSPLSLSLAFCRESRTFNFQLLVENL